MRMLTASCLTSFFHTFFIVKPKKGCIFAADFRTFMQITAFIHFRWVALMTLFASVLLLMSCHSRPSASESLAEAERIFVTHPDSVKTYSDLLRSSICLAEEAGDDSTAARACLLLARQIQWTNEQEALHLARKALGYYDHTQDSDGRLQAELTIAGLMEQAEEFSQARSLYNKCLHEARELHLIAPQRTALAGLANICLTEGKEEEALQTILQIPSDSIGGQDVEARFVLANCYLQCDSLQQAREIYLQIDTRHNTKVRYAVLRHLAEIAMWQEDMQGASLYVDSAFAAAEDVFFEALQQKEEYHQANLEQERQAERLAYRQRLAQWLLAAVVVIALLVIAFIVSLNRHRHAIQHQRLLAEQRERELAEERLQRQEQMVSLLQNFIIEKSEILQRLQKEGDSKITLNDSDWREIEETLDSITNGFVQRLRKQHPEFREEDIQLCMMTRMRLTNQAIAQIYLITVSAVKHRKLKLKKEGFGEKNPIIPLDEVLMKV